MFGPDTPGVSQIPFLTRLVARYNPGTSQVWIGAPSGWAKSSSEVLITVTNDLPRRVQVYQDGSFIYKFPGDENSTAEVEWTDTAGTGHSEIVMVTNASEGLELFEGEAGLYPNRMIMKDEMLWVVNSGDDALTSYDLATETEQSSITTPLFSNPWEVDFIDGSSMGFLTTLFAGVYCFDSVTGLTSEVALNGFRDFASPNGVVTIRTGGTDESPSGTCWVANPNPVGYFPTTFGQGFISRIEFGETANVSSEINTLWLNPQHVITDGDLVYVSCSGTIDFMPPDYKAVALDRGGVHVIDPDTSQIIKSYDLGICGPGAMALSPDGRYLYIGSGVEGSIFRIDLEEEVVLNNASNPIVISDFPGTYIPFIEVSDNGLLACASFNTDTIRFMDSRTGELDPFPFFGEIELHPDELELLWGPQDAVFATRNGREGLILLTTVESAFHWIEF